MSITNLPPTWSKYSGKRPLLRPLETTDLATRARSMNLTPSVCWFVIAEEFRWRKCGIAQKPLLKFADQNASRDYIASWERHYQLFRRLWLSRLQSLRTPHSSPWASVWRRAWPGRSPHSNTMFSSWFFLSFLGDKSALLNAAYEAQSSRL